MVVDDDASGGRGSERRTICVEVDKVDMYKSFRPGDIVKAEVLSLGDSRSYTLSTAKNELGVILAHSVDGNPLVPISWQEMYCRITDTREYRKVAKIA